MTRHNHITSTLALLTAFSHLHPIFSLPAPAPTPEMLDITSLNPSPAPSQEDSSTLWYFPESFPSMKLSSVDSSSPDLPSVQTTSYLSLSSLAATHPNPNAYHLTPPNLFPGEGKDLSQCVVICIMRPIPDAATGKDTRFPYACAPSCTTDVGDERQPIGTEQVFGREGAEELDLSREENFNVGNGRDDLVVVFGGIISPRDPGYDETKDGTTIATEFRLACAPDSFTGTPLNPSDPSDENILNSIATRSGDGDGNIVYTAPVLDPYTVGRYNALWTWGKYKGVSEMTVG